MMTKLSNKLTHRNNQLRKAIVESEPIEYIETQQGIHPKFVKPISPLSHEITQINRQQAPHLKTNEKAKQTPQGIKEKIKKKIPALNLQITPKVQLPITQKIERPARLLRQQEVINKIQPVPQIYREKQEPVIIPIFQIPQRSRITRRQLLRESAQVNDQDYEPVQVQKLKRILSRRFAPFSRARGEVNNEIIKYDVYHPHYASDNTTKNTQITTYSPKGNIPIIPIPSMPSAYLYNYSPESDVEIAPVTRLVIAAPKPQPIISSRTIVTAYFNKLLSFVEYS